MKGIFLAAILFFGVATASAQTDLQTCSQMLGKSLEEVSTCRDRTEKQEALIALLQKQNGLLLDLLTQSNIKNSALEAKNQALGEQVQSLIEIKCNEKEWYFKPFGWKLIGGKKKDCYK